jgi:hypothetical protein
MTDDLQQRLDRLATELTAASTVPPPAAVRRLGRRRRYRQVVLLAVVAVALAGLAAGPGDGLLGRGDAPAGVAGPAATAPALQPPRAARGQVAVVIQDPPPGFPERISGRISARNCGGLDTGANIYRQLVIAELPYRGQRMVFNVLTWPATKEPPLQPRNFRAPWVVASRQPPDGNGGEDRPFLVAERPQTRLHLDRADGTRGSIVGAYRVVRGVSRGSTTTIETVRNLTGAQLAMTWNCTSAP